jgi:hypothetical protein
MNSEDMRPAVGVEDRCVEVVVELPKNRNEALLVDSPVSVVEWFSEAELLEDVVGGGEGEVWVEGLLALAMSVEFFAEEANSFNSAGTASREWERLETGGVIPHGPIFQSRTHCGRPHKMNPRRKNGKYEGVVGSDDPDLLVWQSRGWQKDEEPVLRGFGCADESLQAEKCEAHRRSSLRVDPVLFPINPSLRLKSLWLDVVDQVLEEHRILRCGLGSAKAKKVDYESLFGLLRQVAAGNVRVENGWQTRGRVPEAFDLFAFKSEAEPERDHTHEG